MPEPLAAVSGVVLSAAGVGVGPMKLPKDAGEARDEKQQRDSYEHGHSGTAARPFHQSLPRGTGPSVYGFMGQPPLKILRQRGGGTIAARRRLLQAFEANRFQ